ncbi:MAG: hypothetical protein ACP5II_05425 [Infirmifilum sp.]|uniref:hypothetical protein n=1 Tax=Infirmifilum TaxID=2856573 RepID=UPI00235276B2
MSRSKPRRVSSREAPVDPVNEEFRRMRLKALIIGLTLILSPLLFIIAYFLAPGYDHMYSIMAVVLAGLGLLLMNYYLQEAYNYKLYMKLAGLLTQRTEQPIPTLQQAQPQPQPSRVQSPLKPVHPGVPQQAPQRRVPQQPAVLQSASDMLLQQPQQARGEARVSAYARPQQPLQKPVQARQPSIETQPIQPSRQGVKVCPHCGRELPYGDLHLICPFCGAPLK